MPLVISLGSNRGQRKKNIEKALGLLKMSFCAVKTAHLYQSLDIYNRHGPPFLNTVAEYKTPDQDPEEVLQTLLNTEEKMGRKRVTPKGPRLIDLDLLFFDDLEIKKSTITIPHPRLFERSFVVRPLSELPCFRKYDDKYGLRTSFELESTPCGKVHENFQ